MNASKFTYIFSILDLDSAFAILVKLRTFFLLIQQEILGVSFFLMGAQIIEFYQFK